jgi:hypothetical protein
MIRRPDDGSSTTSETSVYSNETTWRCIPEGYNLYTRRRENLKSRKESMSAVYIRTAQAPEETYLCIFHLHLQAQFTKNV